MEERDVAQLVIEVTEEIVKRRISRIEIERQDRGLLLAGKTNDRREPVLFLQPTIDTPGKPPGGEYDDTFLIAESFSRALQCLAGLGGRALGGNPFDGDDDILEFRIHPYRVRIGKEDDIVAHLFQQVPDGDPICKARRMVGGNDESAGFRHTLNAINREIKGQLV